MTYQITDISDDGLRKWRDEKIAQIRKECSQLRWRWYISSGNDLDGSEPNSRLVTDEDGQLPWPTSRVDWRKYSIGADPYSFDGSKCKVEKEITGDFKTCIIGGITYHFFIPDSFR